mmetsp:Transcript_21170/g.39364  ORF Transcript_21170/g.39364 Transcript_21170/m.39364 type:complete len:87 (-) Transcript_21170:402-662(-)
MKIVFFQDAQYLTFPAGKTEEKGGKHHCRSLLQVAARQYVLTSPYTLKALRQSGETRLVSSTNFRFPEVIILLANSVSEHPPKPYQ